MSENGKIQHQILGISRGKTIENPPAIQVHIDMFIGINNVLLVKIEGPVWYTIYHHLPVVKGVSSNPSINQPTNGKRTSMIWRL